MVPATDSTAAATEYLRQVVPLISKHGIAATPRNYALLYHYVSGRNATLVELLDAALLEGKPIEESFIAGLYHRFLDNDSQVEANERIGQGLSRLVAKAAKDMSEVSSDVSSFGSSLADQATKLSDPSGSSDAARKILADTMKMKTTSRDAQARLQETTDELQELRCEMEKLKSRSKLDFLTQVYNRGEFDRKIAEATQASASVGSPLLLAMVDIDHFKSINDRFGHVVGDKVIRYVASLAKQVMGEGVHVSRYGGEEFALIFEGMDSEKVISKTEKLRTSLLASKLQRKKDGESIGKVTLSCGVARHHPEESEEAFIGRADSFLYQAKNAGRNRLAVEPALEGIESAIA